MLTLVIAHSDVNLKRSLVTYDKTKKNGSLETVTLPKGSQFLDFPDKTRLDFDNAKRLNSNSKHKLYGFGGIRISDNESSDDDDEDDAPTTAPATGAANGKDNKESDSEVSDFDQEESDERCSDSLQPHRVSVARTGRQISVCTDDSSPD